MSEQSDIMLDIDDSALCVATDTEFFVLSADKKTVLATVEYYEKEGQLHAHIYAPAEPLSDDLPSLKPGAGLYFRLASLIEADRIVTVWESKVLQTATELYQVHDRIAGVTWRVGFDDTTPRYEPGKVYLYQPDGERDPQTKVPPPARFSSVEMFSSHLGTPGELFLIEDRGAFSASRISDSRYADVDRLVFRLGQMARSVK